MAPASVPVSHRRARWQPIAISDAVGTLGSAHGNADLAACFASDSQPPQPFPFQRFSLHAPAESANLGHYFPAELALEADGLRMGPKGLRRLDAFQRLCIEQARIVMSDCPEHREEVGIVCCTNLGGETGLQLSRHYAAHLAGRENEKARYAECTPTLEAIASSLPSLTSGFAAIWVSGDSMKRFPAARPHSGSCLD
jgi:hypothetical protein